MEKVNAYSATDEKKGKQFDLLVRVSLGDAEPKYAHNLSPFHVFCNLIASPLHIEATSSNIQS